MKRNYKSSPDFPSIDNSYRNNRDKSVQSSLYPKMKLCAILVLIFTCTEAANVFIVATCTSHNHYLWIERIALGLAQRGHNVTALTHDWSAKEHANYHLLKVKGISYQLEEEIVTPGVFYDHAAHINALVKESEALKSLLDYPPNFTFDIILWDLTSGENLYPIVQRFGNPPIIGLSPFGVQPDIHEMMGNQLLSYIPSYEKHYSQPMSLWERIENIFYISRIIYERKRYLRNMDSLARQQFGSKFGDIYKFLDGISVVLVNSDPSFDYAQPLPPNIISVGGLHVEEPTPLPNELNTSDIIYLGTSLDGPLLSCLGKLEQTIVLSQELPGNFIQTNLSQNDILAHPNTRLFISQGSLHDCQTAITYGVPLLLLPTMPDYKANSNRFVELGYARQLNPEKLTEYNVCEAIQALLHNSTYKTMVQKASRRIKSRLNDPLDTAVHWVEYILENGAAEHLAPPGRHMSPTQTLNLDILAIILVITLTPLVILWVSCCTKVRVR